VVTTEELSRRMLNKTRLLTRTTLAVISPARPESAKTASSPRDAPCPKQGRSELSLSGVAGMIPTARNVLTRPPTGRYFSPALPSDCFAIDFPGRAICLGEGLLVFPISPSEEQPDCPSLRASDEHRFIVRVLRAQRMVWLLPSCSSQAERCASTGIVSATHLLFQHLAIPSSQNQSALRRLLPSTCQEFP
jgi:hypothetical protein